ncbi:kow motif domain protein [Diplodia corticola]|uniref:Kow motif domain protein n=1 Tax=Diplodia corticola TaxID=236234 RepID=A0A1J9REL0_9PEZI|nr:kow motif domain protein [Diplodia corticola]OJD31003.1 kow motif domain protein [Diplodia corticola]
MQKAIQRTAMAKRQAARKSQKATEMEKAFDRRSNRKELQQIKTATNRAIADAKLRRREDWLRGPLAPRRDVGEWREKFATVDTRRAQLPDADPYLKDQLSPFAEGDRVVILKGRDKGKIGEVNEVDEDSRTVRIKDLNLADVYIPEYMRQNEGDKAPIRTIELKLAFDDVRLVWALPDKKTGKKRDVIISEVVRKRTNTDKDGNIIYTRFVPGTDITIPFPKYETPPPSDQPADTLRILSEEQTFVPTLLRPPMPPSVIDELRNKYSYFRDRHDPEWVKKKLAEDEAEKQKDLLSKKMITPLKEMHARQRRENRAKGRQPLPEEALVRIGEMVAAHKAAIQAAKKTSKTAATVHA